MTIQYTIEKDVLALLALAAIFGVALGLATSHSPRPKISLSLPVVTESSTTLPSLDPTLTTVVSQVSPDGTHKITMTAITNNDGSKNYTFATSDSLNDNKHNIYTVTLPSTDTMTIPFNSWSPDNTYLFLKHTSPQKSEVLVMQADGEALPDGSQYNNVTGIFTARQTGYTYEDTTGWASETLLIINTTNADGSKGPSYWEEVPSKAVIQLSTEF